MKVFAFLPPFTDYICPVLHGDSRLPWSNKSQSVLKIIQSKGVLGELVRCQFNNAEHFIFFSRWREYWIAFALQSLTHGGQCRIILLWLMIWFLCTESEWKTRLLKTYQQLHCDHTSNELFCVSSTTVVKTSILGGLNFKLSKWYCLNNFKQPRIVISGLILKSKSHIIWFVIWD